MGAPRDNADGSGLRRLSKSDEMEFVAGGHASAQYDTLLKLLQSDPDVARELGAIAAMVGADLQTAYPGETRETAIPNAEWERAGYERVVEMNKLMGLEGL